MFENYYKDKVVLVTGHTGFKGSWLSIWLSSLGAKVIGISNEIPSNPSNFEVCKLDSHITDIRTDVCDSQKLHEILAKYNPDYIFHLAAQALVRPSYENPLETMKTNAIGTASVLEAIRLHNKKLTAIMITSDKAYDNVEWVWGYRETDKLGGKDPYSASKGMAELAIRSYVESYFTPDSGIKIGITRAGNVIGGGDWAVDRIVPDCMRSWSNGHAVDIRSPDATRPWQHVLEPLSGYLLLGCELSANSDLSGEAYNFGPPSDTNYSVRHLIDEMSKYWENIKWNDVSKNEVHLHEAGLLKLNCDKALFDLNWKPTLYFEDTVRMTVNWYKKFYEEQTENMYEFTHAQISEYTNLATERGINWSLK